MFILIQKRDTINKIEKNIKIIFYRSCIKCYINTYNFLIIDSVINTFILIHYTLP